MTVLTLGELASQFSCELLGDASLKITGVGSIEGGKAGQIGFIADPRYAKQLNTSGLSALIVSERMRDSLDRDGLICRNPHALFAHIATCFNQAEPAPVGVHPSAVVDPGAEVHESANIGPGCVVMAGTHIAEGCVIGPRCVIEQRVIIGKNTRLIAAVTVCHESEIGESCLIHPGVVIGSDGFGLAPEDGHWIKVPQLGKARLGDRCEIGANTTIDRGALDDTVIGNGVKIDNLVQVAHNVIIGDDTAIAACAGIAGSARIGESCRIGGSAGVLGHLDVCDGVTIMAKSLVTKSITKPGVYSSAIPATDHAEWAKQLARVRRLDALVERVNQLENQLSSKN